MAAALAALNRRFLTPIYVLFHLGSFGFLDARRHHGSSITDLNSPTAGRDTDNTGLLFNGVGTTWRF